MKKPDQLTRFFIDGQFYTTTMFYFLDDIINYLTNHGEVRYTLEADDDMVNLIFLEK